MPLEKLKQEIKKLSKKQYRELREWFIKWDWEIWDEQIKRDSEKGELDFFLKEAEEEKKKGELEPL